MRSRTSYFNRTLFLKTVTRFWPLWFIYFAVWFVAMPLVISSNLSWGTSLLNMQGDICTSATVIGVVISLFAACVAAMAVWSFMYSARSTSGMASLPLRRECVFVSVSLGGFVPMLAVHVLIFLLSLAVQAYYGVVDAGILGQWLAAVSLELMFFYGFALVCAQLTGNLAVLPLVYLVLNFVVYVARQIIYALMTSFVYGASDTYSPTIYILSPVMWMLYHVTTGREMGYDPNRDYSRVSGYYNGRANDYYEVLRYYVEGWGTLLAYAAVGLALCALAMWLYRRRRMESAGDVVAVNILKPVFKYCMTFGSAMCVGSMLYEMTLGHGFGRALDTILFGDTYTGSWGAGQWPALALMIVYMFVGAFIGCFASEMLIHKSFRVWRGRGRWLGLGVSALVIAALMLAMELDLAGYEKRMPNPGNVESVRISSTEYEYISGGLRGGYSTSGGVTLSEPENIAAAVELHRSVVGNKGRYEGYISEWRDSGRYHTDALYADRYISLTIDYELKNGKHLIRSYRNIGYFFDDPSSQTDARAAQTLLNTPEAIAKRKATALDYTAETIFSAAIECAILPGDAEKAVQTTSEVYDDGNRITEAEKYGYEVNASAGWSDTSETNYSAVWHFTPEEAAELYNQCILPDMAEGTIGTVWLIADEEYKNTVYNARISMDARVLRDGAVGVVPDYRYEYFYTVPTVNSVRTNRWLAEHGVILRTIAETGG